MNYNVGNGVGEKFVNRQTIYYKRIKCIYLTSWELIFRVIKLYLIL